MAKSRKRKRPARSGEESAPKKLKTVDEERVESLMVEHPTLCLFYTQVVTLRSYLLSSLPPSSRSRRRKISGVGHHERSINGDSRKLDLPNRSDNDGCLAALLDKTLVGIPQHQTHVLDQTRQRDFASFSQQANLTTRSSFEEGTSSIVEIVDFAIWLLFHRIHHKIYRPLHLLCHGYQRARASGKMSEEHDAMASIPGVVSHYPNSHVSTLKSAIWADAYNLLGKEGDRIMLDMILNCGVFVGIKSGKDNFYQLCGTPLTELRALSTLPKSPKTLDLQTSVSSKVLPYAKGSLGETLKSSAAVVFVRNRMFYARAALNGKGRVRFGLRHIHVLNRYQDAHSLDHTIHVMKYIFPRQFGLHNAFTSTLDPRETIQPFKDYTLREQEIARRQRLISLQGSSARKCSSLQQRLPKRLRGVVSLVKKLQILHSRCSYKELLGHYCPLNGSRTSRQKTKSAIQNDKSQLETAEAITSTDLSAIAPICGEKQSGIKQEASLVDFATPSADVSAFCRATISKIIPNRFWGDGKEGTKNMTIVMENVDRFIQLRRFENLSLHLVSQGLKLRAVSWLIPPTVKPDLKVSRSDFQKRQEIFLEFIYYIFDSVVIPLIRSNFHVTESNVHGNRLFFFRHDIWRRLTEPSIVNLKLKMFEEIKTLQARRLLDARVLGFSQIRLLPKKNGVRPIMNLRRRVTKLQHGKMVLGRSINSVMAPVFNMLDYERKKHSARVGSALFSVGEIYPRLKAFRNHMEHIQKHPAKLYFVKVDVQSCFDTIPQRRVVRLMENITSEDEYRIARHAEIKSSKTHTSGAGMDKEPLPARKFVAAACAMTDFQTFDQLVTTRLAVGKRNTVFVDNVVQMVQKKDSLLDLLEEHVERNMVKIGKKFFRQKAGIPQGSVLSSLLCNYFYAELEAEYLGYLKEDEGILLRLIDDFLLITTNKSHATTFLQIMHDGIEKYGVNINPAKSLVNFKVNINGFRVPQLAGDSAFPYCGIMIDIRTLEITKDRDRRKNTVLSDSLTVEPSKSPGKTFHHKALNAFKIQTHKMFLDTNFNSLDTVLSTIYQNFVESAMKFYRYAKCMTASIHPPACLLVGTIRDLFDMAFVLIKAKPKQQTVLDYGCVVSKHQVQWLAAKAFNSILRRKQCKYGPVLEWLDGVLQRSAPTEGKELMKLARVVRKGEAAFKSYKY